MDTGSREGLPKETTPTSGASYCYGYALAAKQFAGGPDGWARDFPGACLLHESSIPASTAGYAETTSDEDKLCYSRGKSTAAATYRAAYDAAFVTETESQTALAAAEAALTSQMSTYETWWLATDNKQRKQDVLDRLGGSADPAVESMWGDFDGKGSGLGAATTAWLGDGWTEGAALAGSAKKALADAITTAAESVDALAVAQAEITRVTAIQTAYET